jgi:hypothetical protein
MFSFSVAPPPDKYLVILAENANHLAAKFREEKRVPSDFSGPPLTKFVCETCEMITEFDGVCERPTTDVCQCGGLFHKIGIDYVRNTVMQPHIVVTQEAWR